MNLFYLDSDLDKCAEYHVDKHVSKMILEAGQILCTNMWIDKYIGFVPRKLTAEEWAVLKEEKKKEVRDFPYLPTMYNHPSTIWARSSLDNFEWTHCYANALNSEYHYRYGREHASALVINQLPDPKNIERLGFTTFGLAMPDELKDYDNPIDSYRKFYMADKQNFASWKGRETPYWWSDTEAKELNARGIGRKATTGVKK